MAKASILLNTLLCHTTEITPYTPQNLNATAIPTDRSIHPDSMQAPSKDRYAVDRPTLGRKDCPLLTAISIALSA